jgi:hypothetical protein
VDPATVVAVFLATPRAIPHAIQDITPPHAIFPGVIVVQIVPEIVLPVVIFVAPVIRHLALAALPSRVVNCF